MTELDKLKLKFGLIPKKKPTIRNTKMNGRKNENFICLLYFEEKEHMLEYLDI